MTAKELAEMLSGRETGNETTPREGLSARDAGLVVVYGYSDDNVEFSGAINDEVGAYNGATIYITTAGVLKEPDCDRDDCPYFAKEREKAKTIKAVWNDNFGGPAWTFETDIPHETFTIVDDGEPWCIGIVFSVADLEVTA